MMRKIAVTLLASAAGVLAMAGAASAHPHVWVTMKSELVYAPDGTVTGIRHKWTFDEMFSTFATQGLETKQKGVFTREDLAPLAEVNVTSLKEYDYFTTGKADGKKVQFTDPKDYWLDFGNAVLTLNFTLPLKSPVRSKALDLEIFDPTYFVDFQFAGKDAVALAGAPAQCKAALAGPAGASTAQAQRLSEAFFNKPDAQNFGAQFANRITVKCQ